MKCASLLIVTVFLLSFLPSDGFLGQNNGLRGKLAKPKQKGSCCSRAGPPGGPGVPGLRGIEGDDGAKGEPGLPGLPGSTGARGFDGLYGQKGCQGEPGLIGDIGQKGEKGWPGYDGPLGPPGEKGDPCTGVPGDIKSSNFSLLKGHKGEPGQPGTAVGIQGKKGEQGTNGKPGKKGYRGDTGLPGVPGAKGEQGVDGLTGLTGLTGDKGYPGDDGFPGRAGDDGLIGPKGLPGEKGKPGTLEGSDYMELIAKPNWKQCAWKKGDDKDKGLIQECTFNKRYDNTSLRVFYGGNLRVSGCSDCCKRWFFTFNDAECTKPMTIEGVVYLSYSKENPRRSRNIKGYCNQAPKGQVRVGFWVGNCVGYKNADAYSGWNSVSRIVIEEVPPPQA